ncbi:MAG: alpha-glucosidase/alpha-galactosidase [Lachnospiraceae bacterium]
MIVHNGKVEDMKICYIGGGSRGWAWTFMTDLAMEKALSGTIRLYDIDREAARNNEIIGNHLSDRKEAVGKWKYEVKDTYEEALSGADFVIISILPGTFDEMEIDVHAPEKYGIYQSVGDTAGPGGMIRALRTLPMFLEFGEKIKQYCPDAWVINYTNPMSLCIKMLYHAFPAIKAFGCCHEVFGTQKVLAGILKEEGLVCEIPKREDIQVNVMGINHFTWFDQASYQGIDIFPVYRRYIEKNMDKGYSSDEMDRGKDKCFVCKHRVKFDLFNRFGLIAAAGDRHLAEFMPGDTYLKNPETVAAWDFALTPVEWRKQDLKKRLERSRKLASFEEEIALESTGEEGILLIKALCGLDRVISNVNMPNTNGQIPNLPREAVVETNAVFEQDKIRPIVAGELPGQIYDLVLPHVENHDRILRAVLTCDRTLVYEAFAKDPLIAGRLTEEETVTLVDDMIEKTSKYLPAGWRK